jgi:hypothetical protein
MAANSNDEQLSSETKKVDPTWIAKPVLRDAADGIGGGSFGGGPSVGGLGSEAGAASSVRPGVPVRIDSGKANIDTRAINNGGISGFGSSRGTGSLDGFGVRGSGQITFPGNDDLPIHRSNGTQNGGSSTVQPSQPQKLPTNSPNSAVAQPRPSRKPKRSSTTQPQPQPRTPQTNPAPNYADTIPIGQSPNEAVDRIVEKARKNPVSQPWRRRTPSQINNFLTLPVLSPSKVSQPSKDDIYPVISPRDPFSETIPTAPGRDPLTGNIPIGPKKDPFTGNILDPKKDPYTRSIPTTPSNDPFGDRQLTNPFPTTSNPNKPSRKRRNPQRPDILRVNNGVSFEEFIRKNPLVPEQKPSPNNTPFPPKRITPPNTNAGQPIQAEKTPGNGGSQNSSSGGNSGQQQTTKKADQAQKKALAKKYADRDLEKLTADELKEFKQGYKINQRQGKKYIQRKREADDYPLLHLAEVNGRQVITEGRLVNARGNSSASTMKREFKEKFGEDVPQGDNLHHLIPVNVWQKDELVRALEKRGEKEQVPVAGVDDGNGLISLPSNSDSIGKPAKKLEEHGGRLKIAHPSSHNNWDKHVKDLLDKQRNELRKEFVSLDKVPIDRLEKSINEVRDQLRKDLREAVKKLEKGNYDNSLDWIDPKYPLKPDPSKTPITPVKEPKLYPRVVQEPTKEDLKAFRQALAALKEKVGSPPQKHLLFDDRHDFNLNAAEKQARTLGYSAILAIKDSNYSYGERFIFQRKDAELGIYRQGDYTQVAVIDLKQGEISMNKSLNKTEHSWLAEQEKVLLAQAPEKQQRSSQKSRGFEMI